MNPGFLQDIVIIAGLAIVVMAVCHRIGIPAIVGLLITGVLAGPHGLSLIHAEEEVEVIAETGVLLLLFSIGIEFSVKELRRIKKTVFLGGGLQVGSTFLVAFGLERFLGRPFGEAVLVGFLLSLSSTAIVLKLLGERNELYSPQGQTSLGILIFQDMVAIPMMLAIPLLAAGTTSGLGNEFMVVLIKALGILALTYVLAKWFVPWLFFHVAGTRVREMFLLTVLLICFGVVWLSAAAGLSLALGAFLAGLIVSESEYSHRALGDVIPLRDTFSGFFFVSIGMLLDLGFVMEKAGLIFVLMATVFLLKIMLTGATTMILGFPVRTAIITGFGLAQIGEFSFILAESGASEGLLNQEVFQLFLALSVITMGLAPVMIAAAPRVSGWVARLPFPERLRSGLDPEACPECERRAATEDHLVIIGFGLTGRNVARAAKVSGIPYVAIEMNPETVKRESEAGEVIFYGDAANTVVLGYANVGSARIVVVAINDPKASRRVIELVRQLSPSTYIVARSRYMKEGDGLYLAGADEVIPEEFETSVEIFTRVLARYLVARDQIEAMVAEIRAEGYSMLRELSQESLSSTAGALHLPDIQMHAIRVGKGSPVAGQTIHDTAIRNRFRVTVLAVRREGQTRANPDGMTVLKEDDVVILMGMPEDIRTVARELESRPSPA